METNISKLPSIGDVILYEGQKVVVIDIDSREDYASISYNRTYILCLLDKLFLYDNKTIERSVLDKYIYKYEVQGMVSPVIIYCDEEVPFQITKVPAIKIRRKTPKVVTVYE